MGAPVILITGASDRIGRATALALAKEGATVVVSGRREAEGKASKSRFVASVLKPLSFWRRGHEDERAAT